LGEICRTVKNDKSQDLEYGVRPLVHQCYFCQYNTRKFAASKTFAAGAGSTSWPETEIFIVGSFAEYCGKRHFAETRQTSFF
jgi:hypothetical protein